MWTCSKCGEQIEEGFDLCWSCGTSKEGIEDPHFLEDVPADPGEENRPYPQLDRDGMEELVTVGHFMWPYQAHTARLELEHAGIPVFLADELTITIDPLLSNAIGGIKVQVLAEEAERARDILEAMEVRAAIRKDVDEEEERTEQEREASPPQEGMMAEEDFWRRENQRFPERE